MYVLKLSEKQNETIAQMLGNGAVAWFTIGVITPLLGPSELVEKITLMFGGLLMSIFFGAMAIAFSGKINKKHART